MDYYTGPFWSDGRLQSSVKFGSNKPIDETDYESRLHDTAYAVYSDEKHRTAADWLYKERLDKVPTLKAKIVKNLPYYGNQLTTGHVSGLLSPLSSLAMYDYILHIYNTDRKIKNGEYMKEIADVQNLYLTDPYNMGNILAPAIYPEAFEEPKSNNTWLRGTTSNEVAPETTWSVTPNGNSFPNVQQNSIVPVPNSEDGNMLYTSVYMPYKPLRKKRQRITARMVEIYNREHQTNYTLKEVQQRVGTYF